MRKKPSPKTRRPRRRQVALLIDSSRAYGRGLLQGVAKFLREHRAWTVQTEERRWSDATPAWLRNWKGDGVIAWVEGAKLARLIHRLDVPAVDVLGSSPDCDLPLIDTENQAVAHLAADHLLARAAPMSRRVFERRFSTRVGRAPKEEVSRLRLERVKELLAETDWTLGQKYSEYLHTLFTQKIGTTPGQFRKTSQQTSVGGAAPKTNS
jgi:AraC-like DNA-binding protein